METLEAINLAIKVRMTRLGINQKQLSERSGVERQTISSNLLGKHEWGLTKLDKIARGLGWNDAADVLMAARNERKKPSVPAEGNETQERK